MTQDVTDAVIAALRDENRELRAEIKKRRYAAKKVALHARLKAAAARHWLMCYRSAATGFGVQAGQGPAESERKGMNAELRAEVKKRAKAARKVAQYTRRMRWWRKWYKRLYNEAVLMTHSAGHQRNILLQNWPCEISCSSERCGAECDCKPQQRAWALLEADDKCLRCGAKIVKPGQAPVRVCETCALSTRAG